MSIDWGSEPRAVGALVAKKSNIHYPNITFVSEFHAFGCMFRGTSCEGQALSASNDCWDWIPRPVPAWTGEGPPPVGAEIEAMLPGIGSTTYFWQRAKVVHGALPDSPGEVLVFSLETTRPAWSDEFRPIRTPEQIAAERKGREITDMLNIVNCPSLKGKGVTQQLEALYDAGFQRKVSE